MTSGGIGTAASRKKFCWRRITGVLRGRKMQRTCDNLQPTFLRDAADMVGSSGRTGECVFKLAHRVQKQFKDGLFGGGTLALSCSTGTYWARHHIWYRVHVHSVICSTSLSLSFPPSSVAWYQALSRRQLSGTIGGSVSCPWTLGHAA